MIAGRSISLIGALALAGIAAAGNVEAQNPAVRERTPVFAASATTAMPTNSERPPEPRFKIKDATFASAYRDASSILQQSNTCSDFFGGPTAIAVLNRLAAQLTKTYLDAGVGIRMSGDYTIFSNGDSSLRYRAFEKAEINVQGAFFHKGTYSEPQTPRVGPFSPNTREARVLMLLHELGHMIEVSPGFWLLPNDGGDEWQSRDNTETVEKYCDRAIRAVARNSSSSPP